MPLIVERFDARQWPDAQLEALFAEAFPAFITADPVAAAYIGRVRTYFAELNIMLVDDETTRPGATGWAVPIRWSGELTDLPTGYTDATRRAVQDHEAGAACDTLVVCGGIVDRSQARRGLAGELIAALRDLPAASGLARVIAPGPADPEVGVPADTDRDLRVVDPGRRPTPRPLAAHPRPPRRPHPRLRTALTDNDWHRRAMAGLDPSLIAQHRLLRHPRRARAALRRHRA